MEDLKACAGFAKKFPKDLPLNAKDSRKLVQSFVNFALYGSPPKAAKHAITIIMNGDNKKEMHAKDILAKSIKDFDYGCSNFLTKLAAISQLVLLAPQECEDDIDAIIDIAVNRVLLKAHPTSPEAETEWMETPDDDMVARTWALRILVNRLRSFPQEANVKEVAIPIYTMLNRLVKEGGEASKKKTTPLGHKNLQRLLAAQLLLKLSCHRRLDALLTPVAFNELALVTHDPCSQIRKGFATKLMKYLGQNRLPPRYFTILFFCAYEPDSALLESVTTWIRARRVAFTARKETTFETIFARLLSMLAHHPDFETDSETLKVMAKYILFYLKCVATSDNLSLIYHVAQRVKGVADGISPSTKADENLYALSDLSQALIRIWEEQNGWTMQSWPGKLKLPALIFKPLESHERAQEIADKVWVDEELAEELEPLVRSALKSKKRKALDGGEKPRKKVKKERIKSERVIKTPKKRKRKSGDGEDEDGEGRTLPSSGPRRKSDRRSGATKSYVEVSSDEDEEDAEAGAQEDEEMAEDSDNETSAPEEDVEMADQDQNEEEEQEAESEPEPEPPAKTQKRGGKAAGKKTNGVAASPKAKRGVAKPAKEETPKTSSSAKSTKSKVKMNGNAPSSSPVANGNVRRSARTRG